MATVKEIAKNKFEIRARVKNEFGEWKNIKRRFNGTKKEANLFATGLELDKENDGLTKDWKLVEYIKMFFKTYKSGKISAGSESLYLHMIKDVENHFKNLPLKKLDPLKYQHFINQLCEIRATSTVQSMHKRFKVAINHAIRTGVISINPCAGSKIVGNNKNTKKTKFLNTTDVTKIEDIVKLEWHPRSCAIIIAIHTGARYAEIIGLTWKDIDFDNSLIDINKTWDTNFSHDFSTTKNESSVRTIYIDDSLKRYLKTYRTKQKELFSLKGITNKFDLVVAQEDTHPLYNKSINVYLKNICKQLSVEKITLHSLRHSHTVQLIEAGVDLKYISARLGHSDISTTLSIYTHISKDLEILNRTRINEFFHLKNGS